MFRSHFGSRREDSSAKLVALKALKAMKAFKAKAVVKFMKTKAMAHKYNLFLASKEAMKLMPATKAKAAAGVVKGNLLTKGSCACQGSSHAGNEG